MAGITITVELDDAALNATLSRAIAGGADLRQPMGEISGEWMDLVRERFAQERDPFGVPWAKRRHDEDDEDRDRPLLRKDGYLFNAIVPDFGSDFAQVGVLKTAGPAKYARIHNEGGEILPKNGKALSFGGRYVAKVVMPKRQYIGYGPDEEASAVEVMTDYVRGLFGGGAA